MLIPYTIIPNLREAEGIVLISYVGMRLGDCGAAFVLPPHSDKTVHVFGTVGTGGVLRIEGSNMPFDSRQHIELAPNGTFTGSATGWTLPTGWAYSSNAVVKNADGTGALTPTASMGVRAGQRYQITYTISGYTTGDVTPSIGGTNGTTRSANGMYVEYLTAANTTNLQFTPSNTARFTIDDISAVEMTPVWTVIADPQGNDLIITPPKIETFMDNVYQFRPFVSAGDAATLLDCYILMRR